MMSEHVKYDFHGVLGIEEAIPEVIVLGRKIPQSKAEPDDHIALTLISTQ